MSTAPLSYLQPNQSLPPELRAGDGRTWAIDASLPPGTTLSYTLTGVIANQPRRLNIPAAGQPPVTIDSNGNATFAVTSAVTAAWLPGRYEWVMFAFDASGQRTQIASGTLRVLPDPNGAVPTDPRTYNQRMLEQIRAVLAENALDDVAMYKVGGRELTKVDRLTLLKVEALFESRVRRERIRKGQFVPTKTQGIVFGGRW